MERHNTNALVPAWLANWYVLYEAQGWGNKTEKLGKQVALNLSAKAISLHPDNSFALSVNALVKYHLENDFDTALDQLTMAIQLNPSESLAWLYKGMLHAFKGESDLGVENTLRACKLSPLDPTLYYYQSLTASAHLTAGLYEEAIKLAQMSLQKNAMHVSTHRCLTISLVKAGRLQEARESAQKLLQLVPDLTVTNYLARIPGTQYGLGKIFAEALRDAGVPA